MKKFYYKATCLKYIEEDDFENGSLPDTARCFAVDFGLKDESLKRLIRNIETVTDGKACRFEDEINRIQVQVLETQEGYKADKIAKRLWQEKKLKLYLADYSFYITKVTESCDVGDELDELKLEIV